MCSVLVAAVDLQRIVSVLAASGTGCPASLLILPAALLSELSLYVA
jgi:hypothetical protein